MPGIEESDSEKPSYQELRIAVVMTGGVSLAVWMGGVTNEINRLRLGEGVYGDLLKLLEQKPRVDVIAGTSAGGLNGIFLATAIAYRRRLDGLRDLWLDKGSFGALFRSPFERDSSSLLRGDEYFLPKIREALRKLVGAARLGKDSHPLRLIVMGSLLHPGRRTFTDGLGNIVAEADHTATFVFRRFDGSSHERRGCPASLGPAAPGYDDHSAAKEKKDDFLDPLILNRLALAGRASASFPIAFEPAFCPVGETTDNSDRPDMSCYASFDRSRYVIDGGVLMNKPIAPALDAIHEQHAQQEIRRVMLYVVPTASPEVTEEADRTSDSPSVAQVGLDALLTLPRSESVASDLEEVQAEAAYTARSRETRRIWLCSVDPDAASRASRLEDLAGCVFCDYREIRAKTSVKGVLDQIALGLIGSSATPEAELWKRAELEAPLIERRKENLPERFPTPGEPVSTGEWRWGFLSIEQAGEVVRYLLNQALYVGREEAGALEARRTVATQLGLLRDALEGARGQLAKGKAYWRSQASTVRPLLEAKPPADDDFENWAGAFKEWADQAFTNWPGRAPTGATEATELSLRSELSFYARKVATSLIRSRDSIGTLVKQANPWQRKDAEELEQMVQTLTVDGDSDEVDTCLRRLLALEVVDWTVGARDEGYEQRVKLVQVSAETPNTFDGRGTPEEKLAGLQLGHFGGFYKDSWRANDWMWGRLDGAFRLVQTLLDPARIRERYQGRYDEFVAHLEKIANEDGWDDEKICAELAFLRSDPGGRPPPDPPESLPSCTRAVARRLQLEILQAELPVLAAAISSDEKARAYETPRTIGLRDDIKSAVEQGLEEGEAEALFRRCEVGTEKIENEMGTDLFTLTAATAVAVSMSAASGGKSGLGPLAPLVKSARGLVLLVYALARTAVRRSRTSFALAMVCLAVGSIFLIGTIVRGEWGWTGGAGLFLLAGVLLFVLLSSASLSSLPGIAIGLGIAMAPWLVLRWTDPAPDPEGGWERFRTDILPDLQPVLVVLGIFAAVGLVSAMRKRGRKPNLSISLKEFVSMNDISDHDARMLSHLRFPMYLKPRTQDRWGDVYRAIKGLSREDG